MSKKNTVPHLALFVKMVTDFAQQNGYAEPVFSFDEKEKIEIAEIDRGSFVQTFRYIPYYPKEIVYKEKPNGLGINRYAPYYMGSIWLDCVRVLYTFGDDEIYYCLHDIFNLFDIKDFSGCEQQCVFSERSLKNAMKQLFSDAAKYDTYVTEVAQSAKLQAELLRNFKADVDVVLPSWKKNGKTLSEQRQALDCELENISLGDIYGYNKMLYHGLPHKALERLYKADKKGKLTVFEKRLMSDIEENSEKYSVKRKTDFAAAQAVCLPVRIITSVLLVPIVTALFILAEKLLIKLLFGTELVLIDEVFFNILAVAPVVGYLLGWVVFPAVVKLLYKRKGKQQVNAVDYSKHYLLNRCLKSAACVMGPFFIALFVIGCIDGAVHSPILGETKVEQLKVFSSGRTQYEYSDCDFYVTAAIFNEEDKAADDGSRELVIKIKDDYYLSDWLSPDELEEYTDQIEQNGGTLQYKNNLDEVDKAFING